MDETAAVCLYPRFIPLAWQTFNARGSTAVRISTVTNLSHGNDCLDIALAETCAAIAYGADEVDIVSPYRALIAGNKQIGLEMVKQASELCHTHRYY